MTTQIAIIGLGQIGASVGLALAEKTNVIQRVGHDRDYGIARKAQKMGAVDRVLRNLPATVRKADLVLLCLPMDQIRETFAYIRDDLRDDVVVMDTGPVKGVVADWAEELLPEKCHYVGLTPVINPDYLHSAEYGLEAARADLFHKGLVAICAPPGTGSEAIKLAADLTRIIGAEPFFADPFEMDGIMASTHILPQLLASALLLATVDRPGWHEGRKIAGRAFAEVTSPVSFMSEPRTLTSSALLNQENVLRVIDGTVAALKALRHDIEKEDGSALESRLERSRQGRQQWWVQRMEADWASEGLKMDTQVPTSSIFSRLFGMRDRPKLK